VKRSSALLIVLAVAACAPAPFDPYAGANNWRVDGVVRLDPTPDWFALEYDRVTACLAQDGPPLSRVRWYTAEHIEINDDPEYPWRGVGGLTVFPVTIYLNVRQYQNDFGGVVRHELIHYITGLRHGELPEEIFDECSRHPLYHCETLIGGAVHCWWEGEPNEYDNL
jgi:hypothetical protein